MWKEWKELAQSLLLGLLLSFLVARLISMALSFREAGDGDGDAGGAAGGTAAVVVEKKKEEKKEEVEGEGVGDEDDWEDVESTELDEAFSAATAFVAAAAADRRAGKVSSEVQLRLYGLYKIATEGPCSAPQPSAIKMSARAKWYCFICHCHVTFATG